MARSGDLGIFLMILFIAGMLVLWIICKISDYIRNKVETQSNARFDSLVRSKLHNIDIFERDSVARISKLENESIEKIEINKKFLISIQNEVKNNYPSLYSLYEKNINEIIGKYSNYLRTKPHPAHTSAQIVDSIKLAFSRCNADLIVKSTELARLKDTLPTNIKDKEKELDLREKKIYESEKYLKDQVNIATDKILESVRNREIEIENSIKKLNECEFAFHTMISEKTIGFPWVAEKYADYITFISGSDELTLRKKTQPAMKAADKVKEYSQLASISEKRARIAEGQLAYYEYLFPWLTDFKEIPDEIIIKDDNSEKRTVESDPAQKLLSSGEWENLPSTEKFQKALDRYWKRKKHNWEIGRDYERFIGHEYENAGWNVTYFGAIKGFEDLGRDLVVEKNNAIQIIQCKYWAADKKIHEKHIFQLFGTCIMYRIDNEKNKRQCKLVDTNSVSGVFVTSCTLSDTAIIVAKSLNIKVIQSKKFEPFPSIKCNIGKDDEKIYHLPFDQMYDRIKIEKHKGEFYCATIAEAEAAGFRRAFRWKGNKS